ncbi:hypothetical protein ET006_04935 [Lactococcus garvieae]|uniref:hypothetical protein n=1 Tax=Lactococcus TaxID=1357 RepID=UPI0013FDCB79|nr:hypothetical protein [Lactococcus petauri]NHI73455.1 hypothetical protein [Lactococcus garvieae]
MNTLFNFLLLIIKVALAMYIAIFVLVLLLDLYKATYAKICKNKSFVNSFIHELKNDLYITFVKVLNPWKAVLWVISLI